MDALLKSGKSKPAKKSHWVSMENLLHFCFPLEDRYPLSTGRLSVFGNYGPLADDGTLRGGRQGSRIVSHMELEAMIEEMQREDILYVYIGNQRLQREEQEEILKQADEELKNQKPLTPEEVVNMFNQWYATWKLQGFGLVVFWYFEQHLTPAPPAPIFF